MGSSIQTSYQGWSIYTQCDESPPMDYGAGRSMVYAVRGFAERNRRVEFALECGDSQRINMPALDHRALHFFDFIKAHEYVRNLIERAIDEREAEAEAVGASVSDMPPLSSGR